MDYAKLLIAEQQLDQAEQILKQTPVINIDRFYREKLARKSIVALFNMLGEDHKLVRQYRPRLLTVHAT
jgi:thioredoxin-like negative regulator of GroEL